jgi:hypothetical protein
MSTSRTTTYIVADTAAIAAAIGGYAAVNANAGSGASSSATATPPSHTAAPGPGQPRTTPDPGAANGPVPTAVHGRQVPAGWHPGSGTTVTGTAPDEARVAALAMFPRGTVNRVLRLSDGSHAVHIINATGPHHVFISTELTVTGVA